MDTGILTKIIILAVLVEALVQTVKPIWEPEQRTVVFYVNLGVGMLLSAGINYLADLDLFAAVGVPLTKAPFVGVILTGILLSRGANFMHDLIGIAQNVKLKSSTSENTSETQ